MKIKGHALIIGDNINTDMIIPARYLHKIEPSWLAEHIFEDTPSIKQKFKKTPKPIAIVAGIGFGYGSSREHAVTALKAAGVSLIIAKSFHRIFYRNAINNGLPAIEASLTKVKDNELILIDLKGGKVTIGTHSTYEIKPIPTQILKILKHGGLKEELKKQASKYIDNPKTP